MILILESIKQGKYSRMQWRKPHAEVLFRSRMVSHVVCKCEPTVAHLIHLESVTFCLVSDALLINASTLKYFCLLIHIQQSTKKPCRPQHFLRMLEKWVSLKVRVYYS